MVFGHKEKISFDVGLKNLPELSGLIFYLGNKLISDESIYEPVFMHRWDEFLGNLEASKFQNELLNGLTDIELYNKLNIDRESNESQYFKHMLQIDETIDQYKMFVIQVEDSTKFIWTCWDKYHCNADHKLNEIYSADIDTHELTKVVGDMLAQMKSWYG